jgi:hypothetical protein
MQREICLFTRTPQVSAPVRMLGVMLGIVLCILASVSRDKSQHGAYTIAVSLS